MDIYGIIDRNRAKGSVAMYKATALLIVRKRLAEQLNCKAEDFLKEGVQYVINSKKKRLPFFQIVAMGQSCVVSVSADVKDKVMPYLSNRTREELFGCPFLSGQSIYFIPDFKTITRPKYAGGLTYRQVEGEEEVAILKPLSGFEEALSYDAEGNLLDKIAFIAMEGERIIGIACAAEVWEGMYEMKVEIAEGYRGQGLASILMGNLAMDLMDRGIVPVFHAASSDIVSQAVAHRSGMLPAWISSNRTYLDESGCFDQLEERE